MKLKCIEVKVDDDLPDDFKISNIVYVRNKIYSGVELFGLLIWYVVE
jgi:hypothetical protein